jgi:hypothetical protein
MTDEVLNELVSFGIGEQIVPELRTLKSVGASIPQSSSILERTDVRIPVMLPKIIPVDELDEVWSMFECLTRVEVHPCQSCSRVFRTADTFTIPSSLTHILDSRFMMINPNDPASTTLEHLEHLEIQAEVSHENHIAMTDSVDPDRFVVIGDYDVRIWIMMFDNRT